METASPSSSNTNTNYIHLLCFVFTADTCTMAEYNKLKSMLLDMQPKDLSKDEDTPAKEMNQKREAVDAMFKYLDINHDGRLSSAELAQVTFVYISSEMRLHEG